MLDKLFTHFTPRESLIFQENTSHTSWKREKMEIDFPIIVYIWGAMISTMQHGVVPYKYPMVHLIMNITLCSTEHFIHGLCITLWVIKAYILPTAPYFCDGLDKTGGRRGQIRPDFYRNGCVMCYNMASIKLEKGKMYSTLSSMGNHMWAYGICRFSSGTLYSISRIIHTDSCFDMLGFNFVLGPLYAITCPVKCGMKLLIQLNWLQGWSLEIDK